MRSRSGFCLLLVLFLGSAAEASVTDPKALGDRLLQEGKPGTAVQEYQKALLSNPSTAVCFNLAIAYYADKNLEGAVRALEKLVEMDPQDTEALYNLGCLMLYRDDPASARIFFEKTQTCCERRPEFATLAQNGLRFAETMERLDPQIRKAVCSFFLKSLPALGRDF